GRAVRAATIPIYPCPADGADREPFPDRLGRPPEEAWARGNYACNGGTADIDHHIRGDNPVNNPPYLGMTKGPVMSVDFGVSLSGIPDGTSSTFLLHEVRIGVNSKDIRGTWAIGLPGASMVVA